MSTPMAVMITPFIVWYGYVAYNLISNEKEKIAKLKSEIFYLNNRMIKLTKIAFVLMASIAMVFIGCKKDTTTSDLTLTVSQDRAIAHLGDTIPLTINASTTNDEIKSVTLTKTGGVSVTIPAVSSTSSYSKVINYIVSDSVGTLVFTITATGSLTSTPITKTLTFSIVKDIPITQIPGNGGSR